MPPIQDSSRLPSPPSKNQLKQNKLADHLSKTVDREGRHPWYSPCAFCRLRTGTSGRINTSGQCSLSESNVAAAKMLLKQQHPQHAALVDQITLPASRQALPPML